MKSPPLMAIFAMAVIWAAVYLGGRECIQHVFSHRRVQRGGDDGIGLKAIIFVLGQAHRIGFG